MVDGPTSGQAGLGFGGLFRRLRDDAGLTQDELAEAAAVSQRAISDLERGVNATARKDTALLLAGALGLDDPARDLFVAAARGRIPAGEALAAAGGEAGTGSAAAASRTLPRDIAAFTGRQDELAQLMERWAEATAGGRVVGIHAIGGMAGIGNSTPPPSFTSLHVGLRAVPAECSPAGVPSGRARRPWRVPYPP